MFGRKTKKPTPSSVDTKMKEPVTTDDILFTGFQNWLNAEGKTEFVECLHLINSEKPEIVRYMMKQAYAAGYDLAQQENAKQYKAD